ncbi:MAG: protoporphyrinogen oxidase, partial [Gemmatimonadaceae bacterium]
VEGGPISFHSTARADALIASLGIGGEKIYARPTARRRYVVRDGTLHDVPTSPRALLKSSLLSPMGKARMLAEIFIPARKSAAEESLAQLVRRRLGQDVLSYLIDPFVSGVYAGDPSHLSASFALPMLGRLERDHGGILRGVFASRRRRAASTARGPMTSFRSGMQILPMAIGAELGTSLRVNHAVTKVDRVNDQWIVTGVFEGAPFTVSAPQLIVATAAHALHKIEWQGDVKSALEPVMRVRYAPVATVALGYTRSQVAHALDGFGVLVPSAELRGILGILFNSSTFCCRTSEDQVLLTVFLGGARQKRLPSAADLTAIAHREVSQLLGVSGKPVMTRTMVWPTGIPQFDVGHASVVEAAEAMSRTFPGLRLVGSYIDGVAIGDCIERGDAAGVLAVAQLKLRDRAVS